METLQALEAAVASTTGIVKGTSQGQFTLPTPCTQWNVHDLMNHMLATLWRASGILQDQPPTVDAPRGGLPAVDLVGDDPEAAYAQASAAALAAARTDNALTNVHTTPLGELPGATFATLITTDTLVHGWDLAHATHQTPEFDAELASHMLEVVRPMLSDEVRAVAFAPEVPIDADAPAIDRLVGFLGRRP